MRVLKISLFTTMLAFCLTIHSACTHKAKDKRVDTVASKTATKIGGHRYVEIDFNKGAANLTTDDKVKLEGLARYIKNNEDDVEKVRVLAWSDKEYPSENQKVLSSDVNLANKRADQVKDYLKALKADENVEVHNMAKRPNFLSDLFNTADDDVKNAYETVSTAPGRPLRKMDLDSGKASKALVILSYEDDAVEKK